MLFIFNLGWKRFSIDEQVSAANQVLESLSEAAGVSERLAFNCASLGAGEWVLPFATKDGQIDRKTLDNLRLQHHKLKTTLRADETYNANRDVSEMLRNLRHMGHKLAAVRGETTGELEIQLKESRTLDFFEDSVFGKDRCQQGGHGGHSLADLYKTAAAYGDEEMAETLVVSDNPEGIEDGVLVHPCAVVGYIDPYTEWKEQGVRIKEMTEAGAHFTAVGGYTVANLPFHLTQRAKTRGFLATMIAAATPK